MARGKGSESPEQVRLSGRLPDEERPSNVRIGQSTGHQPEHLQLPVGSNRTARGSSATEEVNTATPTDRWMAPLCFWRLRLPLCSGYAVISGVAEHR